MNLDLGIGLSLFELRCGTRYDAKGAIHLNMSRLQDYLQMWFMAQYAFTGGSYRNPIVDTLIRRLCD